MSDPFSGDLPRAPLIGAAMLVVGSLALAVAGRSTDLGRTSSPPGTEVAAYEVRLIDRDDGALAAYLADGTPLAVLDDRAAGFPRGVIRGFARGRKLVNAAPDAPYRLIRYTDGRLIVEDTTTHERIDVDVFGPSNAATFASLWRAGDDLQRRNSQ